MIPFMESSSQIIQILQILSFLLFPVLIVFGPRIMVWQADRKLRSVLSEIEDYHHTSVDLFTDNMKSTEEFQKRLDSMKNFQFSAPTQLDPAGMVGRLENVLDASEQKFKRFIDNTQTHKTKKNKPTSTWHSKASWEHTKSTKS